MKRVALEDSSWHDAVVKKLRPGEEIEYFEEEEEEQVEEEETENMDDNMEDEEIEDNKKKTNDEDENSETVCEMESPVDAKISEDGQQHQDEDGAVMEEG